MIQSDQRLWMRSFGNLAAGESATSVLRLVALLLVARRLGPSSFGTVSVGLVVGGYLLLFAHPGLEVIATRRIATEHAEGAGLVGSVVGLRLLLGGAAYPAAVFVTLVLPLDGDTSAVIVVFGLLIFTQVFDVRWAFVGIQRTASVAFASVTGAIGYLLALTLFVHDSGDLVWVAIIHVGAQVLISVVLVAASWRQFGRWLPDLGRRPEYRSMIAESFPLSCGSMARAATLTIDVVFVKAFRPAEEAGHYAAASRIMIVGLIYVGLYYNTLLPSLVHAESEGHDQLRSIVVTTGKRSAVLGAVVAVSSVLLVPIALPLVFGDDYRGAVGLLQVLMAALFLNGLSGLANNSLIALGRERALSAIMVFGLLVNIVGNSVLLPLMGAVGAAIATVAAEAAVLIAAAAVVRADLDNSPLAAAVGDVHDA